MQACKRFKAAAEVGQLFLESLSRSYMSLPEVSCEYMPKTIINPAWCSRATSLARKFGAGAVDAV